MDDLLTIGAFGELVGLPASALRHYDAQGLLLPEAVDAQTGYRYYAPAMIERGRLLARLRVLGVGTDELRRVVALDPGAAAELLLARAERELADARERAQGLRAAAEGLRAAPEPAGRVRVDGGELRAALAWVAPLAGESPLDRVAISAGDDGTTVAATNRYCLALRRLATAAGEGRLRVVVDPSVAVPDGDVELASLGVDDTDFPDLARVSRGWAGDEVRETLATAELRDMLATAGETIDIGPSRFTTSLLALGVERLTGRRCVLTASAPAAPHRLVDPDRPGEVVHVMPLRVSPRA